MVYVARFDHLAWSRAVIVGCMKSMLSIDMSKFIEGVGKELLPLTV